MEKLRQEGLTCGQITRIGKSLNQIKKETVFGENIDVIVNVYDLGKIAVLYDLDSKTIHKSQYTSASVIFGDDKI